LQAVPLCLGQIGDTLTTATGDHAQAELVREWGAVGAKPPGRLECEHVLAPNIVFCVFRTVRWVFDPQEATVDGPIEIVRTIGTVWLLADESLVLPILRESHLLYDHSRPNHGVRLPWVDALACEREDEIADVRLPPDAWFANGECDKRWIVVWG
jgi:hypothetical protein